MLTPEAPARADESRGTKAEVGEQNQRAIAEHHEAWPLGCPVAVEPDARCVRAGQGEADTNDSVGHPGQQPSDSEAPPGKPSSRRPQRQSSEDETEGQPHESKGNRPGVNVGPQRVDRVRQVGPGKGLPEADDEPETSEDKRDT